MKFMKLKKKDIRANFKVNIDRRKKTYPIDPVYEIYKKNALIEIMQALQAEEKE